MKRPFIIITALVYLISSIPYVFGFLHQTPTRRFTGIVFDVVDTAQYYAWMRAFSHHVLIANPLTPDQGAERFFNLQWWLLGLLAYDTPLGATAVYQLLRVIALVGFALALVALCRLVIPRHTLLAFVTVMLSSGFGWILVVLKQWSGELRYPLDVQIAEANTLFSAMAFPHLLVAAGLMLSVFVLFLSATDDRRWIFSSVALLVTFVLGFSHGYDLIPTMIIPSATVALLTIRNRQIPDLAIPAIAIVIGATAPALYAVSLTRLDATWRGVLSQYGNAGVYTPSPPHLMILLGLPLILALWQIRPAVWQQVDTPGMFIRVWLIVGFGLLYIPTDYQIKMLTGYQVPVGILAAETLVGLSRGWERYSPLQSRMRPAITAFFILGIVLTNVYLTAWRMVDLRRTEYPYYLSDGDVETLARLNDLASSEDIVLASPDLGMFVPVYSDARPYVAHWAQTLNFFERRDRARWFYGESTPNADRGSFLHTAGIDFVLSGPAEAALATETTPVQLPLEPLFGDSTILYAVGSSASVNDE